MSKEIELKNFEQLEKDVKDSLNNLQIYFEEEVRQYLKDNYPEAGSISFSINDHEWDDGDATVFSIYFFSGTVYNNDEDVIEEDVDISDISNKYPDILWEHAYRGQEDLIITID